MGKGHNIPATGELRAFVFRIERIEEEKRALADDIKVVYAESKAAGFDAKTIRKMIALRRIDDAKRKEDAALLEAYSGALGFDLI
tara:strand:+ start:1518 stop:1772 length:255 start_codon:yes stop_codon:yes gene_type:complete